MRIKDLATRSSKLMTGTSYFPVDADSSVDKVAYSEMAKQLIEEYNTSTLAGTAQSTKAAIDGLKTSMDAIAARVSTAESQIEWMEIVHDMQTGNRDKYAIGDLISDPWTDTAAGVSYDNPWRVNHFETADTESGIQVPGMWLQTKYAHPFGVQFSHQRAFLACPDGLAVGTYYFSFEASWGTHISAGDIVCFTISTAVPAGGCVAGCYGASDNAKSTWRIYTYAADRKTILQTITPSFTASGKNLGTLKATTRSGNLNNFQEMCWGHNRWSTSAIRQYLNSDAAKGEWWSPQDAWDIAPDQLASKDGFLRGLSDGMRASIVPVKYATYTNTVCDGGEADITYDKVGLISLEQMYVEPQISGEGDAHDYYKQLNGTNTKWKRSSDAYDELIHYAVENHSAAQTVRLRSATRGNASSTWRLTSSGQPSTPGASNAIRFAPLVFIG